MYIAIWKYRVKTAHLDDFEELYGQHGAWVQWFRGSRDYISTELVRSANVTDEYVTIDRWKSKKAYDNFYELEKGEFERIDEIGNAYTSKEELVGSFTTLKFS